MTLHIVIGYRPDESKYSSQAPATPSEFWKHLVIVSSRYFNDLQSFGSDRPQTLLNGLEDQLCLCSPSFRTACTGQHILDRGVKSFQLSL